MSFAKRFISSIMAIAVLIYVKNDFVGHSKVPQLFLTALQEEQINNHKLIVGGQLSKIRHIYCFGVDQHF